MVKVKLGSVVMVGVSRSGGGLDRQLNSEGYIVVSRVSSAACRSRFPSIAIELCTDFVSSGKCIGVLEYGFSDEMTAKRNGRSSGRALLGREVTVFGRRM